MARFGIVPNSTGPGVTMTLIREWMPTGSYSSRGGSGVRLIVIHTAEGARTIESLGDFFANEANQVSSHTGADNQKGRIGEYVTRGNKAWTAADYNPVAVQIEMCGFASWSTGTWKNQNHNMLVNCADWIREESQKFGIPITKLNDSQAQGGGRGVCQHINLGAGGGGHVDCGNGFPIDYVLDLARGNVQPAPPKETTEDDIMFYLQFNSPKNPDSEPAATVAIPKQYANGKHKLRLAFTGDAVFRCYDEEGRGDDIRVYTDHPNSVDIRDGAKAITVRAPREISPVSASISER